ncbi:MAG TPA: hypothetical protein VMW89_02250 [Desulfatiglandales bacterium]|nr:hypothetical protein [Desulfatiglandales bacterium]
MTLLLLLPALGWTDYRVEMIPRISLSEVYDDNINLDSTDEKSDYITTLSPGIDLRISSLKTSLTLDYAPTWVWYDKNDQYDTIRQAGTLDFGHSISEHLRFNFSDTYIKSEEPLELYEEVESARTTRNTHQRNRGTAGLRYQFGPEDNAGVGYSHNLLLNEDPTLDDGAIQNLFGDMDYWFNIKNGIQLNYGFTKAIFWRDDGGLPDDDYDGNEAGITYIHRFSRQTRASAGYDFTNRNFEGTTEDYKVHEVGIDLGQEFSPDLSLNLGIGQFWQQNEISENETGYTYDALLEKRFNRGSFSVGGRGGWDEAYLEAERRGFTRFWSANTSIEYRLLERLTCYAGAFYRKDRDPTDREWETVRGNGGLRLAFLRWFSATLDYSYAVRDDDVDMEDYRVNRVMLTLTATKPQRL